MSYYRLIFLHSSSNNWNISRELINRSFIFYSRLNRPMPNKITVNLQSNMLPTPEMVPLHSTPCMRCGTADRFRLGRCSSPKDTPINTYRCVGRACTRRIHDDPVNVTSLVIENLRSSSKRETDQRLFPERH